MLISNLHIAEEGIEGGQWKAGERVLKPMLLPKQYIECNNNNIIITSNNNNILLTNNNIQLAKNNLSLNSNFLGANLQINNIQTPTNTLNLQLNNNTNSNLKNLLINTSNFQLTKNNNLLTSTVVTNLGNIVPTIETTTQLAQKANLIQKLDKVNKISPPQVLSLSSLSSSFSSSSSSSFSSSSSSSSSSCSSSSLLLTSSSTSTTILASPSIQQPTVFNTLSLSNITFNDPTTSTTSPNSDSNTPNTYDSDKNPVLDVQDNISSSINTPISNPITVSSNSNTNDEKTQIDQLTTNTTSNTIDKEPNSNHTISPNIYAPRETKVNNEVNNLVNLTDTTIKNAIAPLSVTSKTSFTTVPTSLCNIYKVVVNKSSHNIVTVRKEPEQQKKSQVFQLNCLKNSPTFFSTTTFTSTTSSSLFNFSSIPTSYHQQNNNRFNEVEKTSDDNDSFNQDPLNLSIKNDSTKHNSDLTDVEETLDLSMKNKAFNSYQLEPIDFSVKKPQIDNNNEKQNKNNETTESKTSSYTEEYSDVISNNTNILENTSLSINSLAVAKEEVVIATDSNKNSDNNPINYQTKKLMNNTCKENNIEDRSDSVSTSSREIDETYKTWVQIFANL